MPAKVISTVYHFHRVAGNSAAVQIRTGQFEMIIPRKRWLPFALERAGFQYDHMVQAANLPATLVEVLISLPLSWPSLWHPRELTMATWRTFSYPFFCLPAWWFAGLGLERLVTRGKLHGITFASSAMLSMACLALLIGLRFGTSSSGWSDGDPVLWGFGFWSVAFALPGLAYIREKSLRTGTPGKQMSR